MKHISRALAAVSAGLELAAPEQVDPHFALQLLEQVPLTFRLRQSKNPMSSKQPAWTSPSRLSPPVPRLARQHRSISLSHVSSPMASESCCGVAPPTNHEVRRTEWRGPGVQMNHRAAAACHGVRSQVKH